MPRLRVLAYNIWQGGRGDRLAEAVRGAQPDVVLVNESPKTPLIWRWRCRRLASSWGLRYVAGGRDAGSNMIAVGDGVQVRSTHTSLVEQPLFRPRRGVVSAQLRVRGRLVGVVACHLSLDPEKRPMEVDRVIEAANRLRGPVLVAGDLNEEPDGPSWRRLRAAGYVDHGGEDWPTFPADEPTTRIDALLVRGAVRMLHHGDPGVPEELQRVASNHRAVLGVVELDAF